MDKYLNDRVEELLKSGQPLVEALKMLDVDQKDYYGWKRENKGILPDTDKMANARAYKKPENVGKRYDTKSFMAIYKRVYERLQRGENRSNAIKAEGMSLPTFRKWEQQLGLGKHATATPAPKPVVPAEPTKKNFGVPFTPMYDEQSFGEAYARIQALVAQGKKVDEAIRTEMSTSTYHKYTTKYGLPFSTPRTTVQKAATKPTAVQTAVARDDLPDDVADLKNQIRLLREIISDLTIELKLARM